MRFRTGEVEALGGVYTEDCVLLPPNGEIARGRDAATATFAERLEQGFKVAQKNEGLEVHGDVAYLYGMYRLFGAQDHELDQGKYVELWRRRGDTWKLSHDVWNTSLPAVIKDAP